MPTTGNLISERFNGGADGVAITTGNSSATAVNAGTPTFETTDKTPIEGSAQAKFDMTVAQSLRWDIVNSGSTPLYKTIYHEASATPSVASSHVLFNVNATTTVRAQIRYLSTGAYRLINQTATVVATTTGTWVGQDVRLRWKLDWGAGTQTLDVFAGANLNGTTPDETISGALTNATRDRIVLGSLGSVSATAGYHLFDYFDVSDTAFTSVPVTRVNKTHATSWDVRARVAKTSATTWDTRARVGKTSATTYDVLARAAKTQSTTWDVLARVAKTSATSWDVASALTRVAKTHATSWDVRARVAKTSATSWDLRARVAKTAVTTWDVRARVGKTSATSWDVASSGGSGTSYVTIGGVRKAATFYVVMGGVRKATTRSVILAGAKHPA